MPTRIAAARPIRRGSVTPKKGSGSPGPKNADRHDAGDPSDECRRQHYPFEADVDHAGLLAHDAAKRGQGDGGRDRDRGVGHIADVREDVAQELKDDAQNRYCGEGVRDGVHAAPSAEAAIPTGTAGPGADERCASQRLSVLTTRNKQDDRLQGVDQLRRHAGLDLHRLGAGPHRTQEQAREHDADRVRTAQQSHRDRVEADGSVVAGRHLVDRRRAGS